MISVIMPLYNNERYVIESIQSVINQTYKNWELIIVNDASTDSSKRLVESFLEEKKDNRIIFIDLDKNKGVSHARNVGIKLSKGEYISFLDSDDLWNAKFLEVVYTNLCTQKSSMTFTKYAFLQDKEIFSCKIEANSGMLSEYIYFNKNRYEMLFPFHIGSILIKKELLIKYKIEFPEDQTLFEDALFICKLLCITQVNAVDEVLMLYRQHMDSAFHKNFTAEEAIQEVIFFCRLKEYIEFIGKKKINKLDEVVIYRTYRVILSIIKKGYINNAIQYIERYDDILKDFLKRPYFRLDNKVKCKLFLLKNKYVLRLIKFM